MAKQILHTHHAPSPIGPYSQGVKAGNFFFLSGQIGIHPESGELINTSEIEEETHLVMQNIGAILRSAGLSYEHIVKTTIFLQNMDDFSKVNAVYGSFFEKDFPSRETVEMARLPKNVRVEISVTAYSE